MKTKFYDGDFWFELFCILLLIMSAIKMSELKEENRAFKEQIESLEYQIEEFKSITPPIEHAEYLVTATVYHAVASQCNSDYLTTASGKKIKSTNEAYSHRYIAVSRDLRELFPYGCKVEVIGTGIYDGIYTVADTMNKRYTEYIDILINPDMPIGKWENVVIKRI